MNMKPQLKADWQVTMKLETKRRTTSNSPRRLSGVKERRLARARVRQWATDKGWDSIDASGGRTNVTMKTKEGEDYSWICFDTALFSISLGILTSMTRAWISGVTAL